MTTTISEINDPSEAKAIFEQLVSDGNFRDASALIDTGLIDPLDVVKTGNENLKKHCGEKYTYYGALRRKHHELFEPLKELSKEGASLEEEVRNASKKLPLSIRQMLAIGVELVFWRVSKKLPVYCREFITHKIFDESKLRFANILESPYDKFDVDKYRIHSYALFLDLRSMLPTVDPTFDLIVQYDLSPLRKYFSMLELYQFFHDKYVKRDTSSNLEAVEIQDDETKGKEEEERIYDFGKIQWRVGSSVESGTYRYRNGEIPVPTNVIEWLRGEKISDRKGAVEFALGAGLLKVYPSAECVSLYDLMTCLSYRIKDQKNKYIRITKLSPLEYTIV
jgi:hypothetical protein